MSKTIEFRCSEEDYSLKDFILYFTDSLPQLVCVTEGFCGIDEAYSYSVDDVLRISHVHKQPRIVAKDRGGRYISIPESYPLKFCVIDSKGTNAEAKKLSEIVAKDYHNGEGLHIMAEHNDVINFWHGTDHKYRRKLGKLQIQKKYEEPYLVGNAIVNGKLHKSVIIMPGYTPIQISIIEGLKSGTRVDYMKVMSDIQKTSKHLHNSKVKGNREIMLYEGSLKDEDAYEFIKPQHFMKTDNFIDDSEWSNPTSEWTDNQVYMHSAPNLPERGVVRTHKQQREAIFPEEKTLIFEKAKSRANPKVAKVQPSLSQSYTGLHITSEERDSYQPLTCSDPINQFGIHQIPHRSISSDNSRPRTGDHHVFTRSSSIPNPLSNVNESLQPDHCQNRRLTDRQKAMVEYLEKKPRHRSSYTKHRFGESNIHTEPRRDNENTIIDESLDSISSLVGINSEITQSDIPDTYITTSHMGNKEIPIQQVDNQSLYDFKDMQRMRGQREKSKDIEKMKKVPFESMYLSTENPVVHDAYMREKRKKVPIESVYLSTENPVVHDVNMRDKSPNHSSIAHNIPRNVKGLSIRGVAECLIYLKLNQYVRIFRDKQIDGAILLDLDARDLMDDFGFSSTDAKRLIKFAQDSWRPQM